MALTRTEMEQIIKEGGSVLVGGQIVARVDQLPSEAALAKGNPEKEQAAQSALEARITAMQAELDELRGSQQTQEQHLNVLRGQQLESAQLADPLPDTFPSLAELRTGSILTYSHVRAAPDEYLTDLGISKADVKKIRAAQDQQP